MRLTAVTALFALLPSAFAHGGHETEEPPAGNATAKHPVHYAMMVFPGFQPLDVYGPLDVIGAISMVVNESLHLSVLSRTMDPVSSKMRPNPNMTHKHSDFGHSIVPTNTFKDALTQPICPEVGDIEVLIVPGGGGTRGDISEEVAFVKEMFPRVIFHMFQDATHANEVTGQACTYCLHWRCYSRPDRSPRRTERHYEQEGMAMGKSTLKQPLEIPLTRFLGYFQGPQR